MTDPTPHRARAVFPFAALVAQDALQQALLLAAIDPSLGGVLVSGPRGTAKSTAARGLAELLPEGQFVTLPLSASDEQVTGSLDLAHALAENGVRFRPGLLARAHLGVLYVDEVNLLADGLVDTLLDVAASGVNIVERDGVSHAHDARFVLVGTMNPEEGELRPQLLDRFGLMVEIENCFDAAQRERIVKARLAFDLDPDAFRARHAAAQRELGDRIHAARARLARLDFDDAVHARVSALCIDAAVDGLRADLVMLRAARALAALERADAVTVSHVERVAEAVLRHRRHAGTPPSSGTSQPGGERDDRNDRSPPDARQRPQDQPGATKNDTAASQGDWGYLPPESAGLRDVKSVVPLPLKKTLSHRAGAAANAVRGPRWQSGTAARVPGAARAGTAVAWPATFAAKRSGPLHHGHLRFRQRAGTPHALHCFVLDCSASMLLHERLALAKGLIVAYFDRAARDRAETALICFGGNGAARRFGPAVPRWWNARWLEPVDGGGGTPLADGIAAAAQLLARDARRAPDKQRWLWVLSDGRTREMPAKPAAADHVVFVDFDNAAVRIGQGARLAAAWGAQWVMADALCTDRAG